MTYTSISERFTKLAARAIKSSRFIALAIIAAVTLGAMQPAQAQSSDTWKIFPMRRAGVVIAIGRPSFRSSCCISAESTFCDYRVAALRRNAAGYAIDKRRRQGEYYNQYGYNGYGDGAPYYGDNGGYYGNGGNGGYDGNGGYNGPYDNGGYPYPSGFQSNKRHSSRYYSRR